MMNGSRCECGVPATRLVAVKSRKPDSDGRYRTPIDLERAVRMATCEQHRHSGSRHLADIWHREIAAREVKVIIGPRRTPGL